MKSKLIPGVFAIALASIAIYVSNNSHRVSTSKIHASGIEALTNCESVGWWDNDGNCVKNSLNGEYFCKDDTWYELTDCKRNK